MKAIAAAMLCACAVSVVVVRAAEEDSLASARQLYAEAAYEDALGMLDRIHSTAQPGADARAVDQYRALCLLALGRTEDADQAIQAVVVDDPSFQPPADASPRVRSAFADVRRRMLPVIVQNRYTAAKAAFDKKDYAKAEVGFKQVLDVLADPDVAASAGQPPLADIKTLATGFRDLSAKAAAPPPAPPAPAPAPPKPATPAPPKPNPLQVFGAEDPGVVPPAIVRQDFPTFEYQLPVPPPSGVIELVIDERGTVESATMRKSIYPKYDARVIEATRQWRYRPATLDGMPVKYRKIVSITVKN